MAVQWLTADEQRTWRAYLRAGTLLTARLNRQLQADSGLSLPVQPRRQQRSRAQVGTPGTLLGGSEPLDGHDLMVPGINDTSCTLAYT